MAADSSSPAPSKWLVLKTFSYGFVSGLACLSLMRIYRKLRVPNPERIKSAVLPMLRANKEIRHNVGSSLHTGLLSATSYGGGIHLTRPRISHTWTSLLPLGYEPLNLKMLFQVIGEKGSCLVSLQTRGGEANHYKYLFVDFNDGQRLIVKENVVSRKDILTEYTNM